MNRSLLHLTVMKMLTSVIKARMISVCLRNQGNSDQEACSDQEARSDTDFVNSRIVSTNSLVYGAMQNLWRYPSTPTMLKLMHSKSN